MIGPPANTRIWIAAGVTDMRSGFNSLAAKVQTVLEKDPYGGHVFIFRGRRGDLLKALYWSDGGLCLFAKRLEKGRFAWPRADAGVVALTTAQLSLLLEGLTGDNRSRRHARAVLCKRLLPDDPRAADGRKLS